MEAGKVGKCLFGAALVVAASVAVVWLAGIDLEKESVRYHILFEGSVTAAGWEAWRNADEPEDFAACLEPQLPGLFDELGQL